MSECNPQFDLRAWLCFPGLAHVRSSTLPYLDRLQRVIAVDCTRQLLYIPFTQACSRISKSGPTACIVCCNNAYTASAQDPVHPHGFHGASEGQRHVEPSAESVRVGCKPARPACQPPTVPAMCQMGILLICTKLGVVPLLFERAQRNALPHSRVHSTNSAMQLLRGCWCRTVPGVTLE